MVNPSPFKEGADVEVTSPNHALRGTLFPGKIVSQSSRKRATFLVEYKTLVTNAGREQPPKRHREELPAALLRPSPPSEVPVRHFKCDDVVDAIVNGGWWEGVVTKVLKGGLYMVYFRSMRQQFVFGGDELRAHREWVGGRWVPPFEEEDPEDPEEEEVSSAGGETSDNGQTQKTKGKDLFGRGALVEVRPDEDGFEGSWYSATIVDEAERDKFLIQYKTLKAEDDSSKYLEEKVAVDHLRPTPPEVFAIDRYDKQAKVDVYANDGWWQGKVVKVLLNMRYKVYFEDTDDEMVANHSDLRPHQEWVNGEWVM